MDGIPDIDTKVSRVGARIEQLEEKRGRWAFYPLKGMGVPSTTLSLGQGGGGSFDTNHMEGRAKLW